jgi:hypothetical protein
MESNTSSAACPNGLGPLAAVVDALAAEDLTRLPDGEATQRVLVLRRLLDRLEGQWLRELAAVDGRGAAGADQGAAAPSTAGWLRGRLRAGGGTARGWVRTARALFRGPLAATAQALARGEISATHAAVLAAGTHHLPRPPPPPPSRCCWRTPPGWTHPRSVGWSPIWSRSPTRRVPRRGSSASTSGVGCGCHPPSKAWSPSTGCWNPKPARRS